MPGRDKLPPPPSSITGELGNWLNQLYNAVNFQPSWSYFSGENPNSSVITGLPGDVLVNITSSSTDTRLWVQGGDSRSTNNWHPLRIA